MANTTVTETACDLCGAEIRDGSLYCYNCGTAVPTKAVESEPVKAEAAPAVAETPAAVPETNNRPPLRSAAALRKQRRAFNRQPVEVSWEPKEQTPMLFIIGSLMLAFGALVLFLIALYLR